MAAANPIGEANRPSTRIKGSQSGHPPKCVSFWRSRSTSGASGIIIDIIPFMSTEFIPPTPTPEMIELGGVVATGILGGLFGRLGGLVVELDYPKIALGYFLALELIGVYAAAFNLDHGDYIRAAAAAAFIISAAVGFFGFRDSAS